MKLGIVGLPNVGKSTLFNAITNAKVDSANYPFCTIEPNIGTVIVPDERLEKLTEMYDALKTTYATIEFVDIAGLVKGASKGEGLGNKFLAHIREVDAIVHVVRCFEAKNIVHVSGQVNPLDDIETINLELILADQETLEKQLATTSKTAKAGDKKSIAKLAVLNKIATCLNNSCPASTISLDDDEKALVNDLFLLTFKPVIYIANVGYDEISDIANNKNVKIVMDYAKEHNTLCIPLCAKLEEELSELSVDDKQLLMQEYKMEISGLELLAKAGYKLLGLMSYLTAGKQEVRAWTIPIGTKAPQAAGKIHTDFERGFIKAEVVSYDILMKYKSMQAVKENGLIRLEGKDYIVQDGDIILFKFNV